MNENERLYEWLSERTPSQLFNIAWDACKELIGDEETVRLDEDGAPYWTSNGDIIGDKP